MKNAHLIFASMIFHLITFVTLGLGSIYQNQLLTGGALVSLALGLLMCKLCLDHIDEQPVVEERVELEPQSDDPYIVQLVHQKKNAE